MKVILVIFLFFSVNVRVVASVCWKENVPNFKEINLDGEHIENLFRSPRVLEENQQVINRQIVAALNALPFPRNKRRVGLNRDEGLKLAQKIKDHPVVGLEFLPNYDPIGDIGYCFGRAMAVHLELLRMRVDKKSIKKIWAFGSMYPDPQTLEYYHVATIVRDVSGGWWAIDPSRDGLLSIEDWVRKNNEISVSGTLRLAVTAPSRFSPHKALKYSRKGLEFFEVRKYFSSYLNYFRSENKAAKIQNP